MRNIQSKKPWRVVQPEGGEDNISFKVRTQADFLREYYPSGHKINSPLFYPDIYREVDEPYLSKDEFGNEVEMTKKKYYIEHVPRYAFSFQQIIAIKQLVHLCGNDVQFDLFRHDDNQHKDALRSFKDGWVDKDMEQAFYELAKSVKITGDGALVCFMESGRFHWKSLSYLHGDKLHPHYDRKGELCLFARSFSDYNEQGEELVSLMEVWDNRDYYLLESHDSSDGGWKDYVFSELGISASGYHLVSRQPHGFSHLPIVYHRCDDGACWSNSQDSIDNYEVSFSQMAHNNKTFGEPILYLKGEGIDCVPDLNGTIKAITMEKEDSAGYLPSQSASESYQKQLDLTYRLIYEQSFAVIPPELRSGDLPAAALKILYSPAYEKASTDCMEFQPAISALVELFKEGYGMETKSTLSFAALPLKCWLKPYVHINWSTTISDLAQSVNSGFLSKQTASERVGEYATPNEWMRIQAEQEAELTKTIEQELMKLKVG